MNISNTRTPHFIILLLDVSGLLNICQNYSLFHLSVHFRCDVIEFLKYQPEHSDYDQKERVLLDIMLEASINYGFLENHLIFCQMVLK